MWEKTEARKSCRLRRCARVWTQLKPVGERSDEAERGEEISGEFVVARGDASEVLEAAEASLDHIALLAIGFSGNDRLDVAGFEEVTKGIGVVAFVREQLADAGDQADAGLRHRAVGR